jgi:Transglycosylase-like domain
VRPHRLETKEGSSMPIDTPIPLARLGARKLVAAGALFASAAGAGAVASAHPPEQPARTLAFVRPSRSNRTKLHSNLLSIARRPAHRQVRHVRHAAHASSGASHGFSIPVSIVMCESGGNYRAVNASTGAGGAYQIMPSTWAAYGGSGLPQNAPPAEQDAIAAKIYATAGPGQWSCA